MLCLHYVNQKGLHPRITMANFPGIYTAKRKDGSTYFRASATHMKKHISLGSFETEETASRAYKEARFVLEHSAITCEQYRLFSSLSYDKFICLINFRDHGIYFKTPIYLCHQYFEYHLSPDSILKFDRDDLFFYSSKKIQQKGGYLFVSNYGSQYSILSRYGIHPFAVYGRDYRMINGDPFDFRYSNILIINTYTGVHKQTGKDGVVTYLVKIHVNGDFIVGTYADEITAAIAYNKAADTLVVHGVQKEFIKNYIESMDRSAYLAAYHAISISRSITNYLP